MLFWCQNWQTTTSNIYSNFPKQSTFTSIFLLTQAPSYFSHSYLSNAKTSAFKSRLSESVCDVILGSLSTSPSRVAIQNSYKQFCLWARLDFMAHYFKKYKYMLVFASHLLQVLGLHQPIVIRRVLLQDEILCQPFANKKRHLLLWIITLNENI